MKRILAILLLPSLMFASAAMPWLKHSRGPSGGSGGGGGGGGTAFVTGQTLGTSRTDGGDYFTGFKMTIGASNVTVSELGRYTTSGSSGTHSIYIASSDGTIVVSGSINASAGANAMLFVSVTPTVLTAGQDYWVLCQEVSGGDTFYGDDTTVTTTAVATVTHSAYVATSGGSPTTNVSGERSYGPVSFKYTSP